MVLSKPSQRALRLLQTSLTCLVIFVQLASPLAVFAETQLEARRRAAPPESAPVKPQPLTSAQAKAIFMGLLQGYLNLSPDPPPEEVEEHEKRLEYATKLYQEALQREALSESNTEASAAAEASPSSPEASLAPVSSSRDDDSSTWMLYAPPDPSALDAYGYGESANWLIQTNTGGDDPEFKQAFQDLIESNSRKGIPGAQPDPALAIAEGETAGYCAESSANSTLALDGEPAACSASPASVAATGSDGVFSAAGAIALESTEAGAEWEDGPSLATSGVISPTGKNPARDLLSLAANGAPDLYVATSGNDANNCNSESTPCRTIQAAIGKASGGQVIAIAPGVYTENITVTKSVTLRGSSTGSTVVDGGNAGRVFYIPVGSTVVMEYLTIRNGRTVGGTGATGSTGGTGSGGALGLYGEDKTGDEEYLRDGGVGGNGNTGGTGGTGAIGLPGPGGARRGDHLHDRGQESGSQRFASRGGAG